MAILKVYNGSSWVPSVGKVWNGTAWVEKMKFYNGTAFVDLFSSVSVVVAAIKLINDTEITGTAYAWVGVNSDGDLYSSITGSTPNVSYETWLDAGANNQVWVEATLTGLGPDALSSGSDSTGVRLACSTTRKWGYTATEGSALSGTVKLEFYDAASGGTLLDTQDVSLSADASGI